jgi:plasmid maintenance system killer protein
MKGKKNRYSVRIDREYRLEFDMRWDNTEKTKGTVILKEISKHYKR